MAKKTTSEPRPDKLLVTTVARTGRFSSKAQRGGAYLTITKGFNEAYTQIAVEVDHTSGTGPFKTHHQHQKALINITFDDAKPQGGTKQMWQGSTEDLRDLLLAGRDRQIEMLLDTMQGEFYSYEKIGEQANMDKCVRAGELLKEIQNLFI